MTLGIIAGPLFCLIGFEFYDKKVLSKARTTSEEIVEVNESKPVESKDEKPKKDYSKLIWTAIAAAALLL